MSKKINDHFLNRTENDRTVIDFRNIDYYEIFPQTAANILAGISDHTVIPENKPDDLFENLAEIIENAHDAHAALTYCSTAQPFNLNILVIHSVPYHCPRS